MLADFGEVASEPDGCTIGLPQARYRYRYRYRPAKHCRISHKPLFFKSLLKFDYRHASARRHPIKSSIWIPGRARNDEFLNDRLHKSSYTARANNAIAPLYLQTTRYSESAAVALLYETSELRIRPTIVDRDLEQENVNALPLWCVLI